MGQEPQPERVRKLIAEMTFGGGSDDYFYDMFVEESETHLNPLDRNDWEYIGRSWREYSDVIQQRLAYVLDTARGYESVTLEILLELALCENTDASDQAFDNLRSIANTEPDRLRVVRAALERELARLPPTPPLQLSTYNSVKYLLDKIGQESGD